MPPDVVAAVREALSTVFDPELDEPITELGFVRYVAADEAGAVLIHLRLPTSFCAPNFAWIMAADAREAVAVVPGVRGVTVELDDHHDSDLINRGLAIGAGYREAFGHEAEESLDALRLIFRRKAHTVAMERALTAWLRADTSRSDIDTAAVTLADLPVGALTDALLRRREALGLPTDGNAPVLVDETGRPVAPADAPGRLRRARSVRISVEGNAHFCRGLLRTRYPDSANDQAPRAGDADHPLLPLLTATKGAST